MKERILLLCVIALSSVSVYDLGWWFEEKMGVASTVM
jgi:hypothetical protein